MIFEKLFKPIYKIDQEDTYQKTKFETLIVALSISSLAMFYASVVNIIKNVYGLSILEASFVVINVVMYWVVKHYKNSFEQVATVLIVEYSAFFIYLYYFYPLESLKFLWLFTYPIILLYLQNIKVSIVWLGMMILFIIAAPLQNVVETQYTLSQSSYISFVFIVVSAVIYYYKLQMLYATDLISKQRKNIERKYIELSKKDSMLTAQSKQAVMGEMMSMIAHQWRQPLSTVTLNISNIQFKKMLGQELSDEELNKALTEISDTVVYLSDTVDDFQTFFHPKKEQGTLEIHELLQKAVNFAAPRTKENKIEININKYIEIEVVTYVNELVQILLNILNNAIDALSTQKKEQAKIIIYVELKGEYVYISLVDNAGGIPDDIVDNIFEPYFSTKGKNGTGLGLYMSQMLAQKQFDGEITFTSSSLGTHFLVKIKKDVSL